ncbi:hypothetical protein ACN20G_32805 (plasmid) [Streptomyces sp. BI20]|uniref:hypothetical protein n=1 Tax=Streptomyces sp. BI20 TaxID=3403460 RepID=UPI003C74E494
MPRPSHPRPAPRSGAGPEEPHDQDPWAELRRINHRMRRMLARTLAGPPPQRRPATPGNGRAG